jgi:hypothetical protein
VSDRWEAVRTVPAMVAARACLCLGWSSGTADEASPDMREIGGGKSEGPRRWMGGASGAEEQAGGAVLR